MPTPLPLTPDYGWNETAGRYVDLSTGQFVSFQEMRDANEAVISAARGDVTQISKALQSGEIGLDEWQVQMMQDIKIINVLSAAEANGGWAEMSQADWGAVGPIIKDQYAYLDNFASEIFQGDQPLNGNFLRRADLYAQSGRGTFEEMIRRYQELDNLMEEERRVLGEADHCFIAGTMVETVEGARPIETVRVGDLVATRVGPRRVVRTYQNSANVADLRLVIAGTRAVVATDNHPFVTRAGWKEVDDLSSSDELMLLQNGAYSFLPHLTLPYSLHGVATFCQVSAARFVSRLLARLPLIQVLKTRMPVPPIPVGLDNQALADHHVYYKIRLDNDLLSKRNANGVKDLPQSFFKAARSIPLKAHVVLKKAGEILGRTNLFSYSLTRAGKFRRVVCAHVSRRAGANDARSSRFAQADLENISSASDGLHWYTKFFRTPGGAPLGVVCAQEGNLFGAPSNRVAVLNLAFYTFARVPIFLAAAVADETAIWLKRLAGAFLADIPRALSYLAALWTRALIRSEHSVGPVLTTQINAAHSEVSAYWAGSPFNEFGCGVFSEIRHVLLLPDSDKHSQIIHHSLPVYNLEVEEANEYIANGFVVHNCNGCLEQASRGWQPIGSLDPIGDEECSSNCHCYMEYRRMGPDGEFIYSLDE